jgi:hypothetical protein
VLPTAGFVGGVEVKVISCGVGPGADGGAGEDEDPGLGSSATTPLNAVVVAGMIVQEASGTMPADVCASVAAAACELETSFTVARRVAPSGALATARGASLPCPRTSKSPAFVVDTLAAESPLPACATSTGWDVLTPLKAMVIIETCAGGLMVALALGVELPTTSVHATSSVVEPLVAL